jgi:nucleoside-diphosphate-sugar epimerase
MTRPTLPTVLVLGATGFIGQALVRRLLAAGLCTRALVRSGSPKAALLADQGVEVMVGDFSDPVQLEAALDGIHHVYHLARGVGNTWADYLRYDVTPTRHLAARCAERGIWLHYTSSIAIYHGGQPGEVIDENTPASPDALRMNAYARAKAENERMLAAMRREHGLRYVVFRPGIVIGTGGSLHPAGVAEWLSETMCRPWGGGRQRLPFLLSTTVPPRWCVPARSKAWMANRSTWSVTRLCPASNTSTRWNVPPASRYGEHRCRHGGSMRAASRSGAH